MRWTGVMAVSIVVSLATVGGFSGSAGASTKRPQPVTCSAISGQNQPGSTLTVSRCTGPTGGSGTVAAPFFEPSTIHWAAGGRTTVVFNPRPQQTGQCPGGSRGFRVTGGKVKRSSIAAARGVFRATFCFDAAGNISLMPGTLMRF